MEDLHLVGGTPAVLKYLLAENFIDGSCMTCTTHSLKSNLEQCPELKEGQDVIMPVDKPIKKTGHLQVCSPATPLLLPLLFCHSSFVTPFFSVLCCQSYAATPLLPPLLCCQSSAASPLLSVLCCQRSAWFCGCVLHGCHLRQVGRSCRGHSGGSAVFCDHVPMVAQHSTKLSAGTMSAGHLSAASAALQ